MSEQKRVIDLINKKFLNKADSYKLRERLLFIKILSFVLV